MKKVAIIGSGISGTSAAYYLNKLGYNVSVFEAGNYFGGHTNTIEVEILGKIVPIDTGFLVHNDRTYPNLIDFFDELKIETHQSEMSFSVMRKTDNLIWAGNNLFSVFAQYKNLFNLRFYKFLREVLHFNKNSKNYLLESEGRLALTLGEMLKEKGYSKDFQSWYLLPMGGCIWSSPTNEMLEFPANTFLRFCMNHGLLQISDRPEWKTVVNGCVTYVVKALSTIDKKYLNEPVLEVVSDEKQVTIVTRHRKEDFDYCIMCTHPPDSLKIFKGVGPKAKELLSKFKYQKNIAVVHLDESVLPKKKIAWAAWNYLSVKTDDVNEAVSVSYLINKLQPLPFENSVIVTLNPVTEIDKTKIIREIKYEHPLFSTEAILAQEKMIQVQGKQRVYFSGAWMRYGFHEDGILSSKNVIKKLLVDDGRSSDLIKVL
ncbi:MAG: FAD-dependent oxidoreductase [Bacteriovorax sp.]|nr:FAD-dependent oxidoreductase [Bacteriovorax sp.]